MRIKAFSDYHDIDDDRQHRESAIELGCFPPKNGGPFQYYGLFYKGGRPSVDTVYKKLKGMVNVDLQVKTPMYEDHITEEYIKEELRTALYG